MAALRRAALVVAALWIALVWLWPGAVFWLTHDDSFYYFQIARNLAAGHGFTFDRINPTNGFHPLWLLLCVPVYLVGLGDLAAVRVLLTLQLLLHVVTLSLLAEVMARAVADWPAQALTAEERARLRERLGRALAVLLVLGGGNPFVLKAITNGLESGIYAPLYTAFLWQLGERAGSLEGTTRAWRLRLAVLGSLCFLARTDAGLLLLCAGLVLLPGALREGARGLGRLAEVFLLPAAVIVGFLLANRAVFGTAMQVSGQLKWAPLTAGRALVLLVTAGGALALLAGGARLEARGRLLGLLGRTRFFAAFLCLLFGYYLGVQIFAVLWYFGPPILYGLLLLLVLLPALLERAIDEAGARRAEAGTLRRIEWVVAAPLFVALAVQLPRLLDPRALAMQRADMAAARWVSTGLPADVVVGSWDAGIIGYFARQRVVNLDGVVNSVEFLQARRDGRTAPLLRAQGVRYLLNHDHLRGGQPAFLPRHTRALFGSGAVAGWRQVRAWPFVFRGSTNLAPDGIHPMAVFLFELDTRR